MNSWLQCLFLIRLAAGRRSPVRGRILTQPPSPRHIPEFRTLVYYDPVIRKSNIASELRKLFARLQCSAHSSHGTQDLMASFGWRAGDMGHQHDAQEFAQAILNAIQEAYALYSTEEGAGAPRHGLAVSPCPPPPTAPFRRHVGHTEAVRRLLPHHDQVPRDWERAVPGGALP